MKKYERNFNGHFMHSINHHLRTAFKAPCWSWKRYKKKASPPHVMEKLPTTKYPMMNATADTDHRQTNCLEEQDRGHHARRKGFAESQGMMRNSWPNGEKPSEGRTERGKPMENGWIMASTLQPNSQLHAHHPCFTF